MIGGIIGGALGAVTGMFFGRVPVGLAVAMATTTSQAETIGSLMTQDQRDQVEDAKNIQLFFEEFSSVLEIKGDFSDSEMHLICNFALAKNPNDKEAKKCLCDSREQAAKRYEELIKLTMQTRLGKRKTWKEWLKFSSPDNSFSDDIAIYIATRFCSDGFLVHIWDEDLSVLQETLERIVVYLQKALNDELEAESKEVFEETAQKAVSVFILDNQVFFANSAKMFYYFPL